MRERSALKTTVSLTRYREPNELLCAALESLARQRGVELEVLVLDQMDDEAIRGMCERLSVGAIRFRYDVIPVRCLSYARNQAIKRCKTPVLLYLDPDAIADEDWAAQLTRTLVETASAVAGGKVIPLWLKRPGVVQRSSLVREQYSLLDLGNAEVPFHKVIGAGCGIHIPHLGKDAFFSEALGRRPGVLLGGEETDLCQRALARGFKVTYNGLATVQHQIPSERVSMGWVVRRMYYAGVSRRVKGGAPSPTHSTRNAWDYIVAPLVIPAYLVGWVSALVVAPPPASIGDE